MRGKREAADHEFLPPVALGLQPCHAAATGVCAVSALGDDALHAQLAQAFQHSVIFGRKMLTVKDSSGERFGFQERRQLFLALREWQSPEVFTIEKEQVKSVILQRMRRSFAQRILQRLEAAHTL